jgi:PAS domain S-box-containing protein
VGEDPATLRDAAFFLDRYRATIEAEVDRRLERQAPPPAARLEIVRRFRSFCRLASIYPDAARPALDGLAGNDATALERAVTTAVDVACECGPSPDVATALRSLETRFRTGLRRVLQPEPLEERAANGPKGRRRLPNAGKRVRSAIDRIGDAYLALCLDTGRIFDLNPAAENLFGASADALLEREIAEFVHPDDRRNFESLEARLDAGEDAGPLDFAFARPGGERVPVELTAALHTISGKRLAIFVARERGDALPSERAYSTRIT